MTASRTLVSSGSPWEATYSYSRAVRVASRVVVAGTAPNFGDDPLPADPELQARKVYEIIGRSLAEVGATLQDVILTRVYVTDLSYFDAVARVHGEVFHDVRPANTTVVVTSLYNPDWMVEIEVEAIVAS
ncbi:MAG: RidA family protein [Actinobacteria bacterium]|nr:RidA family protein [Actinomycetota bacterium]